MVSCLGRSTVGPTWTRALVRALKGTILAKQIRLFAPRTATPTGGVNLQEGDGLGSPTAAVPLLGTSHANCYLSAGATFICNPLSAYYLRRMFVRQRVKTRHCRD